MSRSSESSLLLSFSGGLDSTTALYEFRDRVKLTVSFNYGSKHNEREIYFAKKLADELDVKHLVIELPFVNSLFSSTLLQSGGDVPSAPYNEESLSQTIVPFRNGIMLSILGGLAESRKINEVMLANHASDHASYPDCRPAFINAMGEALKCGTDGGVSLFAPYTNLDKRAIALKGKDLSIDYSKTWSCYRGGEVHCGTCPTCQERRRALEGFDTTEYLS